MPGGARIGSPPHRRSITRAARRPGPHARRRVYTDGSTERYQVIVEWDVEPIAEYAEVARIGSDGARTGYDALYDPAAAAYLLTLLDQQAACGAMWCSVGNPTWSCRSTSRPGCPARSRATPAWSSAGARSSRCSAGSRRESTPTSRLNRVLGRIGNPNVARLLGAYETRWAAEPCPLGMVTAFAPNSAEGWDMATASARDLYAEG